MHHLKWTDEQDTLIVRALLTVATINGTAKLSDLDRALINGLQEHLLYSKLNIDDLKAISPDEFAMGLNNKELAEQALQFIIVMPYAETKADGRKVALVDAFADALEIHPETLTLLHQARDRNVMMMEYCIFRKLAPGMIKGDTVIDKFRTLKPVLQLKKYDIELALKHERLGLLPEGTLGRSIWQFYRTRGFTFPGEGHINMNEDFILIHDISHIIAGFDTTPEGEIGVSAFQGGNMKEHGWLFSVIGMLDFQLGLSAYKGPATIQSGRLDPELFLRGLEMGLNSNTDLAKGWNPWDHMDRQLDDLRKEYNIIGAPNIHTKSPEGWWSTPPEAWWKY